MTDVELCKQISAARYAPPKRKTAPITAHIRIKTAGWSLENLRLANMTQAARTHAFQSIAVQGVAVKVIKSV